MQYRTLPHEGEQISVIGLGMGSIHQAGVEETERTVRAAIDAGVNFLDFVPSEAAAFEGYARALRGQRDKVMLQVHLGADYSNGKYGFTTDFAVTKREFEARLAVLDTDYADFGFIHCIDEDTDFDKVMNGGTWDYACRMKQEGVIRHLGFSTHSVDIARRFLATGAMDLGMFSINPMYDYTSESAYGKGEADDRAALYREFERAGVGISVMKAFAGGRLLDARQSPLARRSRMPNASSTRSTARACSRFCRAFATGPTWPACWRTWMPRTKSETTPCLVRWRRSRARGRACTATIASRARRASALAW